jgi:tetratricopeptide (TPR) repeat protein
MSRLAATYYSLGLLYEAEKLQVKCLELCRKILGEQHQRTLGAMNYVVRTYYKMGRTNEVITMMEEVIFLSSVVFGSQHTQTKRLVDIRNGWEQQAAKSNVIEDIVSQTYSFN